MGRKAEKKQKKVSSESEEEQEEIEELDEDQALMNDPHQEQQDLHNQHEEVLQILEAQTKEGSDEEKMTWFALYSLKQQEIELNNKMREEINAIKDKYDLLKQPIFEDIAAAASGNKVKETLYKPEGLKMPENYSKLTPTALPDYWLTVFTNSGIIEEKQDLEAFGKLSSFKCELMDQSGAQMRLIFKFKEEPSLFSNKELTIECSTNIVGDDVNYQIKVKEAAKWKGKKNENSVFYILFNPSSNPKDVAQLVAEFYRDFCNSIFFYIRNSDLDVQDLEDDDEDEESEEPKPAKKQKKELQKPECKQQ